jgi:hypothetical protein
LFLLCSDRVDRSSVHRDRTIEPADHVAIVATLAKTTVAKMIGAHPLEDLDLSARVIASFAHLRGRPPKRWIARSTPLSSPSRAWQM